MQSQTVRIFPFGDHTRTKRCHRVLLRSRSRKVSVTVQHVHDALWWTQKIWRRKPAVEWNRKVEIRNTDSDSGLSVQDHLLAFFRLWKKKGTFESSGFTKEGIWIFGSAELHGEGKAEEKRKQKKTRFTYINAIVAKEDTFYLHQCYCSKRRHVLHVSTLL